MVEIWHQFWIMVEISVTFNIFNPFDPSPFTAQKAHELSFQRDLRRLSPASQGMMVEPWDPVATLW